MNPSERSFDVTTAIASVTSQWGALSIVLENFSIFLLLCISRISGNCESWDAILSVTYPTTQFRWMNFQYCVTESGARFCLSIDLRSRLIFSEVNNNGLADVAIPRETFNRIGIDKIAAKAKSMNVVRHNFMGFLQNGWLLMNSNGPYPYSGRWKTTLIDWWYLIANWKRRPKKKGWCHRHRIRQSSSSSCLTSKRTWCGRCLGWVFCRGFVEVRRECGRQKRKSKVEISAMSSAGIKVCQRKQKKIPKRV